MIIPVLFSEEEEEEEGGGGKKKRMRRGRENITKNAKKGERNG